MAKKQQPKEAGVEIRMPDDMTKPAFANVVQANRLSSPGAGEQTILTFVHVYLVPGAGVDGAAAPAGDVVARVTLGTETAIALKELLDRQVQLLGGEPEEVAQAARPSRRAARKKRT